jgi:hypothetical protein
MLFIPGPIMALLTFPGVICHEIAHRFFCDLCGVPVYKACYLQLGTPAGYVVHGQPSNLRSAFLISIGPMVVNTLLCSLITFAAVVPIWILKTDTGFDAKLLMWIGVSIGMHAFPSNVDMKSYADFARQNGAGRAAIGLANLMHALFGIANLLSFFWFNLFYALLVAAIVPCLILGIWV